MSRPLSPVQRAMALAAVSGSRTMLGPALLAASRRSPNAGLWAMAAMGEMFMDKLGVLPPRYRPALLIPRAIAGAYVAHQTLKDEGIEDQTAVAGGAVVAAGVAAVAPMLRIVLNTGFRLPDSLVGLAEDALAVSIGAKSVGLSMEEITNSARHSITDAVEQLTDAVPQLGGVERLTGALAGALGTSRSSDGT